MNKTLDEIKMVHEEEMQNFDRIQSNVVGVMHRHGCKVIQTPVFEDYDTYGTYFPALQREMIKTIDTSGQVLVMRPDVTVPLAKMVAREFPDPSLLLKFGYVSTVFREYYGKSTHGKYFLQSGVEVLGDATAECDGEVITIAAEFLEALGIRDMRIDIGTVAYMDALFDEMHLPVDILARLRKYMEERNLVAFDEISKSLSISDRERRVLLELPKLFGGYGDTMRRAKNLCVNAKMKAALTRLSKVYEYLSEAGYVEKVQMDLGFTSHMGYYTDLVFKVYAPGALYSLISGGRYDDLASQFHVPRPACGFGMNMNLLYEFMADANLLEDAEPVCDLAVVYDAADARLIRLLSAWRKKGHSVMGISGRNKLNEKDYKMVISYEKGRFKEKGKIISVKTIEERLRDL